MSAEEAVVRNVLAALEQEPGIALHRRPIQVAFDGEVVTLSGEVDDVAAKKLALELAAAVPGVSGIVDRLRVAVAEPMEDGALRDHVCHALLQEPAFSDYAIRTLIKGELVTVREPSQVRGGELELEIEGGVVTLNGRVGSLSHKRLAGVLAWWVPGSRDVVNGLEVVPPMEDNDDEVVDALRLVLEKDPFVNASQLRVRCHNYVVTLEGEVPTANEKEMAEADAWYIFRVNRVVNNIIVAE